MSSAVSSVSVADVDLSTADKMKVLWVVLDRRLAFNNHVAAVARSCNYHAQAIRHIRHLLTWRTFVRTDFARRAFRFSAPHTWNALTKTVMNSDSLGSFKSRLKTFLFCHAYNWQWHDLPPASLKSRPYGVIEIWILLLLLLLLM